MGLVLTIYYEPLVNPNNFYQNNQIKTCLKNRSGLNESGLMIYITIIDLKLFCFTETFIESQTELLN